MPTPIGHALAGLAVGEVMGGAEKLGKRGLGVLIFCATAPDLDLVLRFVDGANHHRGPSHSLIAAVVSGLVALGLRRVGIGWMPGAFAIGAAWASHVLLDYLGLDTSPPAGEMALWPFSDGFYASPVSIFYDVPRSLSPWAIRHNMLAVAIELVVMIPVVALCSGSRARR